MKNKITKIKSSCKINDNPIGQSTLLPNVLLFFFDFFCAIVSLKFKNFLFCLKKKLALRFFEDLSSKNKKQEFIEFFDLDENTTLLFFFFDK